MSEDSGGVSDCEVLVGSITKEMMALLDSHLY